ncbi:hypothetical protein DUT91_05940 [Phyllobacterium salinisoli]|uniref:SH3b domain-containing protein n=1 Tax=Phyllobacterium salinisoli TaxID=1899321 RepID=A0A368K6X3_9HYPH|nr:hypothetical protein DUT91_05940 [Phyllobacterium salinisoli]
MNLRGGFFSTVLVSTVLFSPSSAQAEPAFANATVNVRTGPGAGYPRVATLPVGTEVDMGPCSGGWCRVSLPRAGGWASARYFSVGSAPGYSSNTVVILGPDLDPDPFWGPPPFWRHRHRPWGPGPALPPPHWGAPSWTGPGPVLPPPYWHGPRGGPHFGPGPVVPHIRPWGIGR